MNTTTLESHGAVAGQVERGVRRLVGRVTDADIVTAFEGTDFGLTDHRHLLALSVLKKALNYHCGHTITQIMVRMGLTTEEGRVTKTGRLFCYEALDAGRSG